MNKAILALLLTTLLISGCRRRHDCHHVDLSAVPDPQLSMHRYGQELFRMDPSQLATALPRLAVKYPVFLGVPPLDTLTFIQIREFVSDPFLRETAEACEQQFPNTASIEKELNRAYRHFLYYYPDAVLPDVYSYVSGLSYEHPVQLHDGILLIALDMYLGAGHPLYARAGIPQYRSRRATPEHLVRDVMFETGSRLPVKYRRDNILLDQMVDYGRLLYFLEATMPWLPDSIRIGFTAGQLDWCRKNERNLWTFLIENELLFSADHQKTHKLITDGPFTSYFPEGSPARTGWYTGWQLVRSFMKNNPEVCLPELMEDIPARHILDQAAYRP
ncbi:MAG: hypothetical protein AVO34_06390 [Firmicutes bacterium ML8_F2]|jgi:hypothetical protein|nr:MAG: hypothetical protein AVO34_06390 [Firmicutes bacterium ML8_F2]